MALTYYGYAERCQRGDASLWFKKGLSLTMLHEDACVAAEDVRDIGETIARHQRIERKSIEPVMRGIAR